MIGDISVRDSCGSQLDERIQTFKTVPEISDFLVPMSTKKIFQNILHAKCMGNVNVIIRNNAGKVHGL